MIAGKSSMFAYDFSLAGGGILIGWGEKMSILLKCRGSSKAARALQKVFVATNLPNTVSSHMRHQQSEETMRFQQIKLSYNNNGKSHEFPKNRFQPIILQISKTITPSKKTQITSHFSLLGLELSALAILYDCWQV